ncbi:MAG: bifunctional riboflavin kinase/FAD synthetase [Eubacteriales bacterium]|nr:bifunctional riboflavin kinase/FAD synthetase [Eubacteriales bacterium]
MIFADYPFPKQSTAQALALGFFDGVHLGHQALLRELKEKAELAGLEAAVFTFADHPKRAQDVNGFPGLLQRQRERLEMLEEYGEKVYVAPVKREVLDLNPEAFIKEILVEKLDTKLIICGSDFRFGKNAEGNVETLRKYSQVFDYDFQPVADYRVGGELVSSTAIRQLLKQGEVERAAELLGRPFTYSGIVTSGQRLGRRLGFPTINLSLSESLLTAALGVYASRVRIASKTYPGISNLGYHPTVGRGAWPRLETYIYDFSANLYGVELEIDLLSFIRPEQKFPSLDEMQLAVQQDLAKVKDWHAANPLPLC